MEQPTQEKEVNPSTFYWVKTGIFLLISSLLVALAVHAFILPNDFTVGGVAGIAILLNAAFNIPTSVMTFCINAPLVIISYFFVKRKFAVLTTISICLQSLWLALFENVFPEFQIEFATNGEKIFAAIGAFQQTCKYAFFIGLGSTAFVLSDSLDDIPGFPVNDGFMGILMNNAFLSGSVHFPLILVGSGGIFHANGISDIHLVFQHKCNRIL